MPNYGWVYQIRPRKPDIINKFYEDDMFIVVLFIDFILLIYVDIYIYTLYIGYIYIYIPSRHCDTHVQPVLLKNRRIKEACFALTTQDKAWLHNASQGLVFGLPAKTKLVSPHF